MLQRVGGLGRGRHGSAMARAITAARSSEDTSSDPRRHGLKRVTELAALEEQHAHRALEPELAQELLDFATRSFIMWDVKGYIDDCVCCIGITIYTNLILWLIIGSNRFRMV